MLPLLYLAIDLWEWCYVRHIYPVAVHVVAQENVLADYLSRLQSCSREWALDDAVFHHLCHWWGTPQVDIFASQDNKKCSHYCSQAGVGLLSLGNAFMISLSSGLLYMFPPITLVQKTIVKI